MRTRGAVVRKAPGELEVVDPELDDARRDEVQVRMVASGEVHRLLTLYRAGTRKPDEMITPTDALDASRGSTNCSRTTSRDCARPNAPSRRVTSPRPGSRLLDPGPFPGAA